MSARLIAEIGADTSGFEAGLNRADAAASRFANKVSGKLNAAFGAGFLIGFLARLPSQFAEQAEKINDGAKKLKVTTDEYQMLGAAAIDAGKSVEEFVTSNAKQGVMLDTLIKRLGNYRDQIKMTGQEVSQWMRLKNYGESFMGGIARPINWAIRAGGRIFEEGSDIAGAIGGTLLSGATLGKYGRPEDYISNFMQRWGLSEKDTGSGALSLPAGYGQQKRYDDLTASLRMLESQEQFTRQEGRTRSSLWNPSLTDWQQGGAFVSRSGMVITEQGETINKLEAIREETRQVKEAIRKLQEGAP